MFEANRRASLFLSFVLMIGVFTSQSFAFQVNGAFPFHVRTNNDQNTFTTGFNFPGDRMEVGVFNISIDAGENFPDDFSATAHPVADPSRVFQLIVGGSAVFGAFVGIDIPYEVALTGPWEVTVTNSATGQVEMLTAPDIGTAPSIPLPANVSVSGSGLEPEVAWSIPALPPGIALTGVNVRKSSPTGGSLVRFNLASDATAFTFPATVPDSDPPIPLFTDGESAIIRVVFQAPFTQSNAFKPFTAFDGTLPENTNLPAVDDKGTYTFDVDIELANTFVVLDPPYAVGYEFAIGPGDPAFSAVQLPEVGDNNFTVVYIDDGVRVAAPVAAGAAFVFPSQGVDRFRVVGIEASAELDPANTLAFMAEVAFLAAGSFTGTMTPITSLNAAIDVKPDSEDNTVNLSAAGAIPVAILSDLFLDAPVDVDPDTIVLAGARVRMLGKSDRFQCHDEDVDEDGLIDLVCNVENELEFMTIEGESTAILEARTFDGTPIVGEDSLRIVPDN